MEGGRRNGAAINNPSRHARPTGAIRAAACLPLSTAARPCIDSRCSPLAPHNSMTSIQPDEEEGEDRRQQRRRRRRDKFIAASRVTLLRGAAEAAAAAAVAAAAAQRSNHSSAIRTLSIIASSDGAPHCFARRSPRHRLCRRPRANPPLRSASLRKALQVRVRSLVPRTGLPHSLTVTGHETHDGQDVDSVVMDGACCLPLLPEKDDDRH